MSLKYFFAGGEVSSHRKLFDINHVEHVSMSYVGLTRRIKFSRPWPVADHFPEYQKVFLDSGTHTLNKPGSVIDEDSAREMAAAYMAFALENLPRLTMVSEFDAQILGREWILAMRGDFWDAIPRDKFLPVWHSGDGIGELEALAERYSRVGVLQGDLSDPNLPAVLNGLVRSSGVLLHGVGMTRMEPMADIAWDSVGSMSWNSPVMHGDFIVWDGRKLHRYPKSRKEASRLRHRAYLHEMGFNTDAIEADTGPESVAEIQRLSIWSWEHFVQDINNRKLLHPFGVTNPIDVLFPESTEPVNEPVDNPPVTGVNGPLVPTTTENRETTLIPVMGVNVFKLAGRDDAGTAIEVEEPRLEIRSKSMRVCNDCFLREKCPGFKFDSTCLYDIPIEIRTRPQLIAVRDALITMQTQRVLFLQMSEQIQGGYPDQNLSAEMDRLRRMIKDRFDIERESITITGPQVHASGNPGYLSSLLGSDVADKMTALPGGPVNADDFIKDNEIYEGLVVE